MSVVHVHVAAYGEDAETGRYTIIVDGEQVVFDTDFEEALQVLDYWTPDRWHINTVLGNLQAAVRDGSVDFDIDPDH